VTVIKIKELKKQAHLGQEADDVAYSLEISVFRKVRILNNFINH
jgi:hypothetical protein